MLSQSNHKNNHYILLDYTFSYLPSAYDGFITISFHRHFFYDFTNLPCTLFLFSASYLLTAYFTFFHCRFFFFYRYRFTFSFLYVSLIGPIYFVGVPYGATRKDKYSLAGKSPKPRETSEILSKSDMGNWSIIDVKSGSEGTFAIDLVSSTGLIGIGIEIGLGQLGSDQLESVIFIFPRLRELLQLESSSWESFLFFLTELTSCKSADKSMDLLPILRGGLGCSVYLRNPSFWATNSMGFKYYKWSMGLYGKYRRDKDQLW